MTMSSIKHVSPQITRLEWGHMTVDGLGSGKDFKLWPGGGREWDWNETGTRHVPGIQPEDITELLEHGANEIILSRGMFLALKTCDATIELLSSNAIPCHISETRQAAALYNELATAGRQVGGLFHSTC